MKKKRVTIFFLCNTLNVEHFPDGGRSVVECSVCKNFKSLQCDAGAKTIRSTSGQKKENLFIIAIVKLRSSSFFFFITYL